MANLNIAEEDLTNVILSEHKHGAASLTNLVLESSSDALRRDATNILQTTFTHQKQIFDFMTQKGWYQAANASQQEIDNARNAIQTTV